jgi:hypothetical protein
MNRNNNNTNNINGHFVFVNCLGMNVVLLLSSLCSEVLLPTYSVHLLFFIARVEWYEGKWQLYCMRELGDLYLELSVFEDKVMRRMLGAGDNRRWRKLHNKELHNL